MNALVTIPPFPPAENFVSILWDRVQRGYPQAMGIVGRAIVQAGGDRTEMLRLAGNGASRGAFLIGCCAEELVAAGCSPKERTHKKYVAEVVGHLRPLARPIPSRKVGPALWRLIAAGFERPVRLRVNTIDYMLATNELSAASALLAEDQSCQLQVECSVTVDGIAGCLMEMMGSGEPMQLEHRMPLAATLA